MPTRLSDSTFSGARLESHDQATGRKVSVKRTTPTPEQHLAASDPRFAALIARSRPPSRASLVTKFDTLAESIAYQQLSGKAAATIFARVRALYPRRKWLSPEHHRHARREGGRRSLPQQDRGAQGDLAAKTLDGSGLTRAALDRMSDDVRKKKKVETRKWPVDGGDAPCPLRLLGPARCLAG